MGLKVHALSTGYTTPSARFRVRQYIPHLLRHGIEVTERPSPVPIWMKELSPRLSRITWLRRAYRVGFTARTIGARVPSLIESLRSPLVWLQKELVPGMLSFEPMLPQPYLFDVDDAVWLQAPWGEHTAKRIAQGADMVLAGSRGIADWFSQYARRVELLPTPVDTDEFRPREPSDPTNARLAVGWIGSQSTLPSLEYIEPALKMFLDAVPDAELRVIANLQPKFHKIPKNRWTFIPWTPEGAPQEVRKLDIGLMPLVNTAHSYNKCGLKMLQYMSCGVPVVVSPFGFNQEVINIYQPGYGPRTELEWVDALVSLAASASLRETLGRRGRAAILADYSLKENAKQLAQLMREVAITGGI